MAAAIIVVLVAGGALRAISARQAKQTALAESTATTRQGSFFLGGPTEYAEILQAWRDDGGLDGLDVRGGSR